MTCRTAKRGRTHRSPVPVRAPCPSLRPAARISYG